MSIVRLDRLLRRVEKLERRGALDRLLEKLRERPLSLAEQQQLYQRIAEELLSGKISPAEAAKLRKAAGQSKGK